MRHWPWVALALLLATNCASGAENLLEKRIHRFIFHGKNQKGAIAHPDAQGAGFIEEAFRHLANHAEVPIAIENLPSDAGAGIPIEIDAKNRTVGEILEEMVSQDRRYIYRERQGLIEVLPVNAEVDPADCLNMVIPTFVADADWNTTFQSLRCQIDRVSRKAEDILPDPHMTRVCPGGSYPVLNPPPAGIIKAHFNIDRVRDILNKLSTMVPNMAWYASFESGTPRCENMSVNSYHPREWYPPDGPGSLNHSEGLPKKCTTCHYHRP